MSSQPKKAELLLPSMEARMRPILVLMVMIATNPLHSLYGQLPADQETSAARFRLQPPVQTEDGNSGLKQSALQPEPALRPSAKATPTLTGPAAEIIPAGPVALPPVKGMTLDDFEAMALTSNPSIARAAALVQAARGNHIQVGLPPNPSVGYEGQQIGSHGLAEQDGVWVTQEFSRGGKLRLNRQVAAQDWKRAEQQLAAQRLRVLTDVRIAYFQVLIAQRQEALSNELLGIARESLRVSNDLLRGKEVGRVDVVQARLEAENADILTQNAQNRRLAAWRSLVAVAGNPELSLQTLSGNLDEDCGSRNWDESLQFVMANSPEVAVAFATLQSARWSVERAMVESTPNVTVQGLYNWRDEGIGGRPDGAITVGIPLPLWDRNQGRIIQAQNEAAAARRALNQLELSLQQRLAGVYERYRNAYIQVEKYRTRILPTAQESLGLMQQLYKGGETPYVNLLTAQRTFSQTNLNYLESLGALKTAEAEIGGLLLSGSLESR